MNDFPVDYDPEKDKVSLVDYDPLWPEKAASEIQLVYQCNPNTDLIVDIQHIGSTAIPGIKSKPIIDLYVGVTSIAEAKCLVEPLKKMSYVYWAENPNPEKMFFVKDMPPFGSGRTHHIHVVEYTSRYWAARVLFRDYLRTNPQYAKEYEALKIELQAKYPCDREAYTDGKNDFVERILRSAGYQGVVSR